MLNHVSNEAKIPSIPLEEINKSNIDLSPKKIGNNSAKIAVITLLKPPIDIIDKFGGHSETHNQGRAFYKEIDKYKGVRKKEFIEFCNGKLTRQEALELSKNNEGYVSQKMVSFFMENFEFEDDAKALIDIREHISSIFKEGKLLEKREKDLCKAFLNAYSAEIENHLDTRILLFFLTLKSRKENVWYQEGPKQQQSGLGIKINNKSFIELACPFPISNLLYIEKGLNNKEEPILKDFKEQDLGNSHSITTAFYKCLNAIDSYIENREKNTVYVNEFAQKLPEQNKGEGLRSFSLSLLNHEKDPRIALEKFIQEMLELLQNAKLHFSFNRNNLEQEAKKIVYVHVKKILNNIKKLRVHKCRLERATNKTDCLSKSQKKKNYKSKKTAGILEDKFPGLVLKLGVELRDKFNCLEKKHVYLNKQLARMKIQYLKSLLTPENKLKESVWKYLEIYENFKAVERIEENSVLIYNNIASNINVKSKKRKFSALKKDPFLSYKKAKFSFSKEAAEVMRKNISILERKKISTLTVPAVTFLKPYSDIFSESEMQWRNIYFNSRSFQLHENANEKNRKNKSKFREFYNGELTRSEVLELSKNNEGYISQKMISFFMENFETDVDVEAPINIKNEIDSIFKKGKLDDSEKVLCRNFLRAFSAEIENHLDSRILLFFLTLKSRKENVWYQVGANPNQSGQGLNTGTENFAEAAHPFPTANLLYIEKGSNNKKNFMLKAFKGEYLRKSYSITTGFHKCLNEVDFYIETKNGQIFSNSHINNSARKLPSENKGEGLKSFFLSILNHEKDPKIALEKLIQEMLDLLQGAKEHFGVTEIALEENVNLILYDYAKTLLDIEIEDQKEHSRSTLNLKDKINKEIDRIESEQVYLNKRLAEMEIQHLKSLLTPENKLKESVWKSLEIYEHFKEIESTEEDVEQIR